MYDLSIPGSMSEDKLKILGQLAGEVQENGTILDVRAGVGRNAYCLAASSRPSVNIISIVRNEIIEDFKSHTARFSDRIKAQTVPPRTRLDLAERSIDLIFICSHQQPPTVFKGDMLHYASKLKPGGVLAGDGYPETLEIALEISKFVMYFDLELQLINGIWIIRNLQIPPLETVVQEQVDLVDRNPEVRELIKWKRKQIPVTMPIKKIMQIDLAELEDLKTVHDGVNWELHPEVWSKNLSYGTTFKSVISMVLNDLNLSPLSQIHAKTPPTKNLVRKTALLAQPVVTQIVKHVSRLTGIKLATYQTMIHHVTDESKIIPHIDPHLLHMASIRVHLSIRASKNYYGVHFYRTKNRAVTYQFTQGAVYLYNNFDVHGGVHDGGPEKLRTNMILDLIPCSVITPDLTYYVSQIDKERFSNLLEVLPERPTWPVLRKLRDDFYQDLADGKIQLMNQAEEIT